MRGNLSGSATARRRKGSIPACAGEPLLRQFGRRIHLVYPRVCGGTLAAPVLKVGQPGLSPRVRGNPCCASSESRSAWSIPACAGEPAAAAVRAGGVRAAVYPRVCGGTRRTLARRRTLIGLSPRVRGNLDDHRQIGEAAGSIPACAGEPAAGMSSSCACWVYPRVCGGTAKGRPHSGQAQGLSPRVRGNLRQRVAAGVHGGSIPACAGEPRPHASRPGRGRVYPRVCGGTPGRLPYLLYLRGLSPRVRGNHRRMQRRHVT